MSPQLIILLLQEIANQAPALILAFEKGQISVEQQKVLFNEVNKLGLIFKGAEWRKD